MSARNKVMVAVVVGLLLLGGYFGAAGFFAKRSLDRQLQWRERMLALKRLTDAQTTSLRTALSLGALDEACMGKLPPRGFKAIVGYLDSGDLPQGKTISGEVTAWKPIAATIDVDFMEHAASTPDFSEHFHQMLDPGQWGREDWRTDFSDASYVVFTVPLNIEYPRLSDDDKSFSAGQGELRTRVLSWPDGQMLCEGRSSPKTPTSLEVEGRGTTQGQAHARAALDAMGQLDREFSNAIIYTPLLEVCAAADEKYCERIRDWLR